MANVIYGGKRIIPAPFVSVNKTYYTEAFKSGRVYEITIYGKILPNKGSPDSTGTFWDQPGYPPDETPDDDEHFEFIAHKVMALQQLFKTEGQVLEFQPSNGTVGFRCNPRVKSMSFPEGPWYIINDYTVTFEADDLQDDEDFFVDGDQATYVKNVSETWTMDNTGITSGTGESKYYVVTHTISATGVRHYEPDGSVEKEAWERAKDFVSQKKGRHNYLLSQLLTNDLSSKSEFIISNNEQIDITTGQYTLTESWTFTDGQSYLENFTVSTTSGTGGLSVTVNGEIRGLEATETDKYNNALSGFDEARILTRAQTYSGETLNTVPLNKTVGKSITDGLITYNYEYNNRPSQIVTDSLMENVTFTFDDPGNVFAEIFVLGRAAGPVLQDLSTVTAKRLTVQVDVLMKPGSSMPNVDSYIYSFTPASSFRNPPQRTWNPWTGNFSHSVSWTYE